VEHLIQAARTKWEALHQDDEVEQEMMLPLIRLKVSLLDLAYVWPKLMHQVETSEAKEMTNPVRFGQDFIGRVANPRDILQYYRKKKVAERSKLPPSYGCNQS
jgi:double-strand break repair protein MRE11